MRIATLRLTSADYDPKVGRLGQNCNKDCFEASEGYELSYLDGQYYVCDPESGRTVVFHASKVRHALVVPPPAKPQPKAVGR